MRGIPVSLQSSAPHTYTLHTVAAQDAERVGGACAWQRDSDRAVDYFGFTRQTWLGTVLKDFAVGRVAYDNWLPTASPPTPCPFFAYRESVKSKTMNKLMT